MTKEDAETIWDAIHATGEAPDLYEDYAGRGSFGQTTTGVVAPYESIKEGLESIGLDIKDYCVDSMGLASIIY